jgi:hypothetical protein
MSDNFFIDLQFNEAVLLEKISVFAAAKLLETSEHPKGFNWLHLAATYGLDAVLLKILTITKGWGLNSQDKRGRTPIHHLASLGRATVLEEILNKYPDQVDITITNYKGRTALHSAAKHLQGDVVQKLIEEFGADVNQLDIKGNSPLSLAYHRHYPGEGIFFSFPAIDYLLTKTQYWQLQQRHLPRDRQSECCAVHSTILSAKFLGMKYANDKHWIPGIQLPLSIKNIEETYTVKQVYQTTLSQFVVLHHIKGNILFCSDKLPGLQKTQSLIQHAALDNLHQLKNHLSPLLLAEKITQIWGIELAGIDAQYLASSIPSNQLVLINSPGLPDDLLLATSSPDTCYYFFNSQDQLHLWGKYPWLNNRKFYTDSITEQGSMPASQTTSQFLKQALNGLKRQVPLHKMPNSLSEAQYIPGKTYKRASEEATLPQDVLQTVTELFTKTTQAIEAVGAQYSANAKVLTDFARYEYCAHGLAYLHLSNNEVVVNWWNSPIKLPIQRIIHHQGLYCYLLQDKNKWIISFQGTDPSDLSSVSRDLDRGSAGFKRLRQQYLYILQVLADKLQQSSHQVKLVICGHSLGGADAQNFFTACIASLASLHSTELQTSTSSCVWQKFISRRRAPLTALKQISAVHLYAYNGAGIRKTSAELAKVAARRLSPFVKIYVNHQRIFQDIVNTVGETTLHDFYSSTANVRSLFFHGRSGFIERVKSAHTDRQFFGDQVGKHLLHQGTEGLLHIQLQFNPTGRKLEPNTFFYNQIKRFLLTGNASESLPAC